MRHKNAFRKLGRTPAHRRALLRNMASSLVLHNRIVTTVQKAKELRRIADRLVTLAKTDSLHNRRQAMRYLFAVSRHADGHDQKLTPVHKLFTEIAPRYTDRHGGYTRVIRAGKRPGDNAELAVIEFVEAAVVEKVEKKRKRRVVRKKAASGEETGAES